MGLLDALKNLTITKSNQTDRAEKKARTAEEKRLEKLRKKMPQTEQPESVAQTVQEQSETQTVSEDSAVPENTVETPVQEDTRSNMERFADQIEQRYPLGIKSLYALQNDMQFCVEIRRVIRNQQDREELKRLLKERQLLQTENTGTGETDGVTEVTAELFEQFMNRLTSDNQGMLFSFTQVADNAFFSKTLPLYEDFCTKNYDMPLEDYLIVRGKLAAPKEKLRELGQLREVLLRCAPDSFLEQYALSNGIAFEPEPSAEGHMRNFHRLVRVVDTDKENRCYACLKLRPYSAVTLLREPEERVAVYNCDNELCGYLEEEEQKWVCTAMGYEKILMGETLVIEQNFVSNEGKFRRKPGILLYFSLRFDERQFVLYAKTHFDGPVYFAPRPKEEQKSPEGYFALNLDNPPEYLELNTRRVEGVSLRSCDNLSDWSYVNQPDGTVLLKDYSGEQNNLTLPSRIDGRVVSEIAKDAFSGNAVLNSVRIPGSIRMIGENAFRKCPALQTVTIGEGCEAMGKGAFADCPCLSKVSSPASLCTLADNTPFRNTPWREETNDEYLMLGGVLFSWQGKKPIMRIPGGVKVYGRCAAAGNPELKEVYFPDGLERISEQAFYPGNKLLEKIVVPTSVRSIGENAFRQTKWLTAQTEDYLAVNDLLMRYRGEEKTIQLPERFRVICDGAFQNCGIDRLWIHDEVTEIGCGAFKQCESLRSVSMGNGVRRIGDSAFSGCRSLTGIFLPDNLEEIGEKAFWGCSMLSEVQYPTHPIHQGKDAFMGTPHILKFGNFAVGAGMLLKYMGNAPDLTIPEGVVEIGPRAFAGLRNLVSVELPKSLKKIDREAFADCVCLYEVSGGEELSEIDDGAFKNCRSLRKYPFTAALRRIGDEAFLGSDLQELTMPKELESIGKGAFGGKNSITVFDTISPDAQRAGVSYDEKAGTVNSAISCALLQTENGELLYDSDTVRFAPFRITVKAALSGAVKSSFYFDGRGESRAYRAFILSCWGRKAEFDWAGFDKIFMKIRNPITRLICACDRLKYNTLLDEDQKTFYQRYLRRVMLIPESFEAVCAYLMQNDDKTMLSLLMKLGAVTEENTAALRQAAQDCGAVKCEKALHKN